MFRQLVSHNDDLRRLVEKGYAVGFDRNHYLVIRDIPYLDQELKPQIGAIVTKFVDAGQDRIAQQDHQIFFAGSVPYGLNGEPIPNLGGGPTTLALSAEDSKDVVVQRSFSHKLMVGATKRDYVDFFEKIETYVATIAGPAIERHNVSPLTWRVVEGGESSGPFLVRDTLTGLAEIGDLAAKFKDDVVALIGTGGTGAYLLDFLVKTPVKEIRAFDRDLFYVHNAFRSPGKLDLDELGKPKAEVYQSRYANFRKGLTVTPKFFDASCADDLEGVTFAFVCVDKGSSRAIIFDALMTKGIPFIDASMGLDRRHGSLNGMMHATYYSPEHARERREKGLAELADMPDHEYRTNIQIGELNSLNACLAIIKFKQLRGFYFEEVPYYDLLFRIGNVKIIGDAEAREN
jgi:ThiF family